ncbi:lysophosphatidylserine lipase ABHD12-like [Aphidius gifuensis]|uniref:lysophosphatidylserine lipase ABHD12-like n=1 Tax=Aphidius gifuensis TaxID=684658 RepID=UPI001CDBB857|nr:lysophosphatidylserine lipase ABHD12-like [Aphidius gifuensis]
MKSKYYYIIFIFLLILTSITLDILYTKIITFCVITSLVVFYLVCATIIPFFIRYSRSVQKQIVFLNKIPFPINIDLKKPETLGINGARNFYLHTNENVKVGVWQLLPQLYLNENKIIDDDYFDNVLSNTSIPIIVYLHGIFSNRALDHRIGLYKLLQKMNYHVITFDYRCFGDSDCADLSEIGVVEDSQYVLQWIMEKVKNNSTPIFVWGHSLGSGISLHTLAQLTAKNIHISGLFLESPFTNIADVYRGTIFYKLFSFLPWFYWSVIEPVDKQNLKFQSDKYIGVIKCPIIVIHAEDDEIVPFKLGEKLYNTGLQLHGMSTNNLQMISIKSTFNCGHKNIYKYEKLPEIIENFITKCSPAVKLDK